MWNPQVQTDRTIPNNKPDIIIRDNEKGTCDTDHYPVIAKVRERLALGKQAAQRFDRQRFNPRKRNELEVRKQYQIENTNRFAAL